MIRIDYLVIEDNWKVVEKLAQNKFYISLDDNRRLAAALEESLYKCFEKGDACQSMAELSRHTRKLLWPHKHPINAFQMRYHIRQERRSVHTLNEGWQINTS
jgi:hypothetical protein